MDKKLAKAYLASKKVEEKKKAELAKKDKDIQSVKISQNKGRIQYLMVRRPIKVPRGTG